MDAITIFPVSTRAKLPFWLEGLQYFLAPSLAPSDSGNPQITERRQKIFLDVRKARSYSKQLHFSDIRKFESTYYFEGHVEFIAGTFAYLEPDNDIGVICSYLHDSVENCGKLVDNILHAFDHPESALKKHLAVLENDPSTSPRLIAEVKNALGNIREKGIPPSLFLDLFVRPNEYRNESLFLEFIDHYFRLPDARKRQKTAFTFPHEQLAHCSSDEVVATLKAYLQSLDHEGNKHLKRTFKDFVSHKIFTEFGEHVEQVNFVLTRHKPEEFYRCHYRSAAAELKNFLKNFYVLRKNLESMKEAKKGAANTIIHHRAYQSVSAFFHAFIEEKDERPEEIKRKEEKKYNQFGKFIKSTFGLDADNLPDDEVLLDQLNHIAKLINGNLTKPKLDQPGWMNLTGEPLWDDIKKRSPDSLNLFECYTDFCIRETLIHSNVLGTAEHIKHAKLGELLTSDNTPIIYNSAFTDKRITLFQRISKSIREIATKIKIIDSIHNACTTSYKDDTGTQHANKSSFKMALLSTNLKNALIEFDADLGLWEVLNSALTRVGKLLSFAKAKSELTSHEDYNVAPIPVKPDSRLAPLARWVEERLPAPAFN